MRVRLDVAYGTCTLLYQFNEVLLQIHDFMNDVIHYE